MLIDAPNDPPLLEQRIRKKKSLSFSRIFHSPSNPNSLPPLPPPPPPPPPPKQQESGGPPKLSISIPSFVFGVGSISLSPPYQSPRAASPASSTSSSGDTEITMTASVEATPSPNTPTSITPEVKQEGRDTKESRKILRGRSFSLLTARSRVHSRQESSDSSSSDDIPPAAPGSTPAVAPQNPRKIARGRSFSLLSTRISSSRSQERVMNSADAQGSELSSVPYESTVPGPVQAKTLPNAKALPRGRSFSLLTPSTTTTSIYSQLSQDTAYSDIREDVSEAQADQGVRTVWSQVDLRTLFKKSNTRRLSDALAATPTYEREESPSQVEEGRRVEDDPHFLRKCTMMELLATEENYLRNLRALKKLLEPFHDRSKEDHIARLYILLDPLIALSTDILGDFRQLIATWHAGARVSDIFLRHRLSLTIFAHYAAHYPLARDALRLHLHQRRHRDSKMKLGDYMIEPVQRIARYCLFVKNLRRWTPPDHPDDKGLEQALKAMSSIALLK
ncbi:uncharacterized protein VTP21DRAFT_2485 [Calcarisporiella thermophila]|uniref:uncharacterized protein n=1 Tax=Calcarisporiella thermophila TaxID=911321 RepID=UPI00374410BE